MVDRPITDADRLRIQLQTSFLFDAAGKLLATNDPDRSPAPRFALFGCSAGNLAAVGACVSEGAAARLLDLASFEPPLVDPAGLGQRVQLYLDALAGEGPPSTPKLGLTFLLPNDSSLPNDARVVRSDSAEGEALLARLVRDGVPAGLRGMGFRDASEFWPPYCVALHEGEIASVAFAARLTDTGACLGLATAPAFRGLGLAAAATAGWAGMASLGARALFYSTDLDNASSRRVVARLDLRPLGADLTLS